MTATLSTNRAGMWCCLTNGDEYQSYPTRELAEQAVRRANAQVRLQCQREVKRQAQMSLGALAMRLGCSLRLMPDFMPSSTSIAHPAESAVCA